MRECMMSCFSCFSAKGGKEFKDELRSEVTPLSTASPEYLVRTHQEQHLVRDQSTENTKLGNLTSFTFRELASATQDFSSRNLLGRGGFGRVYKGTIPQSGQIVAVKQLDSHGSQGNKEFLAEIRTLSILNHPNLVHLIGYCSDGNQRLLVYEYMPLGALDEHLIGISLDQEPLSWKRRMKVALDAALGLEYLHEKAKPPIIYRDLKSSNILLDDGHNAKLSDFGLVRHDRPGDRAAVSSRVMGTYGYAAPEYIRHGVLNPKIDVYSYGVLMLELITGRRTVDSSRPAQEQGLVLWAEPMLKDQRRYKELVDPRLGREYPEKSLNQAIAVAVMCLQEEPTSRPLMTDVVVAMNHLANPDEETGTSKPEPEKPLLIEECRSEEPIHAWM